MNVALTKAQTDAKAIARLRAARVPAASWNLTPSSVFGSSQRSADEVMRLVTTYADHDADNTPPVVTMFVGGSHLCYRGFDVFAKALALAGLSVFYLRMSELLEVHRTRDFALLEQASLARHVLISGLCPTGGPNAGEFDDSTFSSAERYFIREWIMKRIGDARRLMLQSDILPDDGVFVRYYGRALSEQLCDCSHRVLF